MGRFRMLRRLKGMERKYSYRFLPLCHSPKIDLFNSLFPACPPLHPCVLLSIEPYLVLSILPYFVSICISLTFSLSSSLLAYRLGLCPQISHLTVFFSSSEFYIHPLTKTPLWNTLNWKGPTRITKTVS